MAQATGIGWTDRTWNPVHGCSIVSTECRHCYAAILSLRYGQTKRPWTPANAADNVTLKPHKLREPLGRGREWQGVGEAAAAAGKSDGMLVFVNSMSDLFHEEVPVKFLAEVYATMVLARRHTFQVLTKRAERMHALLTDPGFWWLVADALRARGEVQLADDLSYVAGDAAEVHAANVWLGVSVGLRQFVGRLDYLRATPAARRFVSAEPLLGPLVAVDYVPELGTYGADHGGEAVWPDGKVVDDEHPEVSLRGIDWVIVGGESGRDHRPMKVEWARALLVEARACGAAFFMKQLGGARPGTPMDELPEDLRVRDFPALVAA